MTTTAQLASPAARTFDAWLLATWRAAALPQWEAVLEEAITQGPDFPWPGAGEARIAYARRMVAELRAA